MARSRKRKFSDEDDAFDENGILKDGRSFRIPMRDSDALQRDVAQFADQNRQQRDANRVTDASGGTAGLHKPGFRIAATAKRDLDCYDSYDFDLSQQWRRDVAPYGAYPYTAAAEGCACTLDGAPGTLVKQGNWLVCTPDDDDDSTSDARSVDQREAAYQKYDSDLRDAWRR